MSMTVVVKKSAKSSARAEQLGREILGPVVNRWMLALHQYISYLDDGNTSFLFCARAGVFIKKLYELHVGETRGGESCGELFWTSRVAACKGVFRRFPTGASDILTGEYRHASLKEMVEGILRNHPETSRIINCDSSDFQERGAHFSQWLKSGTTDARIVVNYLEQCGSAFDKYLRDLIGNNKKVVLIDSGWQGSTQWLLANAYPEIEWKGLYFGRIMSKPLDHAFVDHVIGLMFEGETFDARNPISAVVHFHHLIEKLVEVGGPSIEEIPAGPHKAIAQKQIKANVKASQQEIQDPLLRGVYNHIREATNRGASVADIEAAYQAAAPELERLILFPSREEAIGLGRGERSADFGKTLKVPVLRLPKDFGGEGEEERIERSLWKQGQIALEFEDVEAKRRQAQIIGLTPNAIVAMRSPATALPSAVDRSVAIITRTKDRPILLRRAAASVASQTHVDYTWVVVNDGGDVERVKAIIDKCGVERHKIVLIDNKVSHGMEAASNLGVRNSQSAFVVIHDDDDSWAPSFLEQASAYLASDKGRGYGGVISRSIYVSEEIVGTKVIEHSRAPYQDWVRNVHLSEMARENFFPPIAFVFRRSVYDEVGGFNEALPVLGDWFFNMEFLLRADIGVIRDATAYYHHRDVGVQGGSYSNSVIGGIDKHEEYASVARNAFLRKHGTSNVAAFAAVSGYFAKEAKRLENMLEGRGPSSQSAVDWNQESGVDLEKIEAEIDRLWLIHQLNSGYVFSLVSNITEYQQTMIASDVTLDNVVSTVMKRKIAIAIHPSFNEEAYLKRYVDVAEVCEAGGIASGYMHYLAYGRHEGRKRFRTGPKGQKNQ